MYGIVRASRVLVSPVPLVVLFLNYSLNPCPIFVLLALFPAGSLSPLSLDQPEGGREWIVPAKMMAHQTGAES